MSPAMTILVVLRLCVSAVHTPFAEAKLAWPANVMVHSGGNSRGN
jgi:hypothetical protein